MCLRHVLNNVVIICSQFSFVKQKKEVGSISLFCDCYCSYHLPGVKIEEKEIILPILKELATQQELEIVAKSILEVYLEATPNLELVENDPMSLFAWLLSIKEKPKLPEGFGLSKVPKDYEELLSLLDRPAIFKAIKERVVPLIRQQTIAAEMLYRFLLTFNRFGDYLSTLEIKDQPSKKIRKYVETKLLPTLPELLNSGDIGTAKLREK